jgi:hypothetical protein
MLIENPAKNNRYVIVRYAGSNFANPGRDEDLRFIWQRNSLEEAIDVFSQCTERSYQWCPL